MVLLAFDLLDTELWAAYCASWKEIQNQYRPGQPFNNLELYRDFTGVEILKEGKTIFDATILKFPSDAAKTWWILKWSQ